MDINHITEINLENFKCFDKFEIKNVGQFNLIVGDNNVGKTSLLEALLFDGDINSFSNNLFKLYISKGYSFELERLNTKNSGLEEKYISYGFWKYIKNDIGKEALISYNQLNILNDVYKNNFIYLKDTNNINDTINYTYNNFGDKTFRVSDINFQKNYEIDNFISLNVNYSNYFFEQYNELISPKQSLIDLFNEHLKTIIPDLKSFHYRKINNQDILSIGRINYEDTIPLFGFGDGAIRLVRIILGMMNNNSSRLMIDEVDTGIHYSRLKDYLKKIVLLSIQNKKQLFLTTHSEECQRYFLEIFNEDEDLKNLQEKVRHIMMYKNKNEKIISTTRNFKTAYTGLELGRELRSI